ncbi:MULTISPECIES: putative bifunctional diguanylate cyclase/phosphodiesterase [Methylobacterium]|jgi:diguanylate cyclase (GGDEF)-like protein|uniref:Diguanylate cyclase/phosphodiesterase n=1 Tax=Methylobacterium radiotolerans (strain ATCC 27329 / DSM 1819 / JCM 2831 / NBRC 15690 / NCIMB 10815 / 0-1) TaxID=426355 RepID=B1M2P8_METRJ|nr:MULTISPECIES: EAL domain-containing protein [Methylobacterium]GAN48760.1 diguanylate cyclase/phosphodiesterase [Methylobacterium sp. ME121]ACB27696.1 diguanylate cyclase/phosphodiesterase [Methylobacterium radiotolerans JCM 2831]KIU37420.1 diguanylate cyclase [Methylobacterium radiotolerans]KTS11806.1 diguanylate cyclase [Methylobacterium radiotolerans]MBN6819944.1 EAL domain-containing protein [Methylobacterium organophilum]
MSEPDYPERQTLLEAAIQALPVGVVVRDGQGHCILANAAARALGDRAVAALPAAPCDARDTAAVEAVDDRMFEVRTRPVAGGRDAFTLTTLTDVTHHHRIQRELITKAFIDALTGLPNRTMFEQSIADVLAGSAPGDRFALAFIDLDNFKHINDYYSHAAGDALLRKMSDRIGGALRPSDLLARIGGDEFVLLLAPITDRDEALSAVRAISERLKQPFFIDGHEIFASASIGLSLFPEHGDSYETLARQADNAMYRVKGELKGGVSLFDDAMSQAATARMAVEQRLRLAIRDRCFCCAFQPKVDMRSHAVTGVEVLLRWRDELGMIQAPGDFIALAIELGLINEITLQLLSETVQAMPDIDEVFGPDVTVSLNIAAKQACDVPFMTAFCASLGETGLAERFVLELTEEAFFTTGRFQSEVLPKIRAIGARVSIDDFGVGYSSLAALADITADELKIDRSFITDIDKRPRSQIVLKAIESLGAALGMTVVAEGVETFEEVAYLLGATQIRCAQGYYFARPLLLDQIRQAQPPRVSGTRGPATRSRASDLRAPGLMRRA